MLAKISVLIIICATIVSGAETNRVQEVFNSSPLSRGWRVFGDASLFSWNSESNALDVTWDSSKPNSYYYFPLGTILTRQDDFAFSFSWYLKNFEIGTTPDKSGSFQMAWGLFNLQTATNSNFLRGTGFNSPNILEFNHFPELDIFGATLSTITISTNNDYGYGDHIEDDNFDTNVLYHVRIAYTSADQTIRTSMLSNNVPFGAVDEIVLNENYSDFRLDAFSISSYSDEGQDPAWDGSIIANALVDDIELELPPPPVRNLVVTKASNLAQFTFIGMAGWEYKLERTLDFVSWEERGSGTTQTNNGTVLIGDTGTEEEKAFYRINATRP